MPDLGDAWSLLLERSEPIASAEVVRRAIERLASEIAACMAGRYPLVLAVMGGAVVFAGQLLPLLRFPLDFDYVHATRYGSSIEGGSLAWRVEPSALVAGRNALVLDDILDGGDTMHAVREKIFSLGAASFRCAVLVDKDNGRAKPIQADFVGLRAPDRFLFGCGMDAHGMWRNLPEIRALKGS